MSVPWAGAVVLRKVTEPRGELPVSVMVLAPVVATTWALAAARPRFWVGELMAAWMLAMVLTRVVYWDEVGPQVVRYPRKVGKVQRAASP